LVHRAVWLSLLASALAHLLLVVLAEPFWRDLDEAEAFRARFAYRPRFEPRRMGALKPRPAPASLMQQLPARTVPAVAPELKPLAPSAIPVRIPETVAVTPPMPGARPDTLALVSEVMPSASEYGWHDLESRDTALDLLRIEDLARADAYRAAIIPGLGGPRDTRGYINFTQLNLYGTGSGRAALEALARYMRDYTRILARVRPVKHRDFLSERLLEDPVHFMFQNGGMPPWSDHMMTNFSDKEKDLLGRYVREGGFLVIESGASDPGKARRYNKEMIELLCGVMGRDGRISPLPASHPINHSYHHFDGFLERFLDVYEGLDLCSANLQGYTYSGGPYGAVFDGKLVAIIGGAGHGNWRGDPTLPSDEPADEPDSSTTTSALRSLMGAVNIVSYVLHRTDGPVVRRELPIWEDERPDVALGTHPEDVRLETLMDAELLGLLDASLALVYTPTDKAIQDDLHLHLDDGDQVDVSGGKMNALLVHNLSAGVHTMELEYGGARSEFEVRLVPDRVTTLTFSLKDFVVFKRLDLKQREERVDSSRWLESFQDLTVEERFSNSRMIE
jgi:hypothetical protein